METINHQQHYFKIQLRVFSISRAILSSHHLKVRITPGQSSSRTKGHISLRSTFKWDLNVEICILPKFICHWIKFLTRSELPHFPPLLLRSISYTAHYCTKSNQRWEKKKLSVSYQTCIKKQKREKYSQHLQQKQQHLHWNSNKTPLFLFLYQWRLLSITSCVHIWQQKATETPITLVLGEVLWSWW